MYVVKEGIKPFLGKVSYCTLSITFAKVLFFIIYCNTYFILLHFNVFHC